MHHFIFSNVDCTAIRARIAAKLIIFMIKNAFLTNKSASVGKIPIDGGLH